MKLFTVALCTLIQITILAQPDQTPAQARLESAAQKAQERDMSVIKNLNFENIGPTIFSGRVTDIEVNPQDPTHFYVAYASGGLWYTDNNGTSFTPIFDHEAVMTIGDIAVDWIHQVIWVGTGENNSSRSSYSGLGMYRSNDHGATWEFRGLAESHHISRIILDPDDPDIIHVAVLGGLYSPGSDRGIYRTTDGGGSWSQTLFVNENAGGVDLVRTSGDPRILYAATWERSRRAWNLVESGPGSGIYKSENNGISWELVTGEHSGFPFGTVTGRIGLATASAEGQDLVYAIVDNYNRRPPKEASDLNTLSKNALREMTSDEFLALDEKLVADYLKENGFPEKYTPDTVFSLIRTKVIRPVTLVEYLEDANAQLLDAEVIGAEVYLSRDGGKHWTKTHEDYLDQVYYAYGYYFGQIRVSPLNPEKLYILGVPLLMSNDGGVTWTSIGGDNVHGDHHALWVSQSRDAHLILGNDGGINISYDDGSNWVKCNSPAVGQFYSVHTDRNKPYHVYGGLQDNGVWGGSHEYRQGTRWHSAGRYPYEFLFGGDGMQVQVDFRDNQTVYTGFQFGNYARINKTSGARTFITPLHEISERPYRWNWQAPIYLSRHQQDILYMGSQYVHRSLDQGDHFEIISPDLTKGGKQGDVPYGTLTFIHESPRKFGLLYTGSDDGLIHVSQDFGGSWIRVSDSLPPDLWVSRVRASSHVTSRVYATLNGYRWDHFDPYLYVSENFGETWERIGLDLPLEPLNVVIEDPVNPNIIYVGSDNGLYVSLDGGAHFNAAGMSLPVVAVHDLDIQPIDKHLLVGTHGRSFYKADISQLQLLTPEILARDLHLFDLDDSPIRYRESWGTRRNNWSEYFVPKIEIPFYSRTRQQVDLTVLYQKQVIYQSQVEADPGLNFLDYQLSIAPQHHTAYKAAIQKSDPETQVAGAENGETYLRKGSYTIKISSGATVSERVFEIK